MVSGASRTRADGPPPQTLRSAFAEMRRTWGLPGDYERFEQVIAWAPTAVIAVIDARVQTATRRQTLR